MAVMKIKLLLGLPMALITCFLLYFGISMLFLVPGYPGEPYLPTLFHGRFLYGTLPFVLGVLSLAMTIKVWKHR
jgi:hypothetical protein